MARILLVDDDPLIQELLTLALIDQGHEVISALDGKQALKMLKQQRVDLILTDVLMPEADGLEVIRAVRRDHPGLPIIAMSGGSSRIPGLDGLYMARALGAIAVLSKPFTEEDLREAIDTVLPGAGKPPGAT